MTNLSMRNRTIEDSISRLRLVGGLLRAALILSLIVGGLDVYADPSYDEDFWYPLPHQNEATIVGQRIPPGNGFVGGGVGGGTSTGEGGRSGPKDPGEDKKKPKPSKNNSKRQKPCPDDGPNTDPSTDAPVILSTGEKYKDEVDFTSTGVYGLSLTRSYRSQNTAGRMFGPNWPSSLDFKRLSYTLTGCRQTPRGHCIPNTVTHIAPDGAMVVYTWVGWTDDGNFYTYTNGTASGGTLTWNYGTRWILQTNKINYTYNNSAYLTKITDLGGTGTVSIAYDSYLRVIRVTNAVGQYAQFNWGANDRVATVIDPAGNTWLYDYNSAGMLTRTTSPGSNPDIRDYHYEATAGTLLTGISMNGVRHTRYSYYADGRVKSSGLENGEQMDQFEYTDFTIVTDAGGQKTTYHFLT